VSVQLNHTIVSCHDQQRSAAFLAGILGLPAATRFGHFLVVAADNDVSLDFAETSRDIASQHYAFLLGEEEFDAAFGRIREQDLPFWADPGKTQRGVFNHRDGGRGLYFEDPNGHLLEIITRPYGSGSWSAGRPGGLGPGTGPDTGRQHADIRPSAPRPAR
jgi:catechol 2,3-dioxygenase-like lactoylglutathione lyase family enzyme